MENIVKTYDKEKEQEREERKKRDTMFLQELKAEVPDEGFHEFLDLLYQSGYFRAASDTYMLVANKIRIDIDCGSKKTLVAIDPAACFDSAKRASVHAVFPMKKRELRRFRNFFDKINGGDPEFQRKWMREAPGCFYGSFATFGV